MKIEYRELHDTAEAKVGTFYWIGPGDDLSSTTVIRQSSHFKDRWLFRISLDDKRVWMYLEKIPGEPAPDEETLEALLDAAAPHEFVRRSF